MLEVLLALALIVVIVVAVASLLGAIRRLQASSDVRSRALGYAAQSLELVTGAQKQLFGCVCPAGGCSTTCTPSDGQAACTVVSSAYTTAGTVGCWAGHALGLPSGPDAPLHLAWNGTIWQLLSGSETVSTFTREIDLLNVSSDPNQKQVTVKVTWTESGVTKQVQLSTVLTAWHN